MTSTETSVKQEKGGWVSPFESWHVRQDQRHVTGIPHARMDYQVQLQLPHSAGYYHRSPPPAPTYTQERELNSQRESRPPGGTFDMQPLAFTVPRLQQAEYQQTGPGPYGYMTSSGGSAATSIPAPVPAPGRGGWYHEDCAGSTPSTTTSGVYEFGSGTNDPPSAPRHVQASLSGHSPSDLATGMASFNSASAQGAIVVGSGRSHAPSGSAGNSPAQAGSASGKATGSATATAGGGGGAEAGGKAVKKKAAKGEKPELSIFEGESRRWLTMIAIQLVCNVSEPI